MEQLYRALEYVIIVVVVTMNLAAFFAMGIDKWLAKHHKRRISEKTLLWLAFAFGGLGSFLGMRFFHHKTMKKKFTIGVPLLFVVNIACLFVIAYFGLI